MGNCIRKGSSTEWGGEDWASFGSGRDMDEPGLPPVLPCSLEVKIKISKKELQKLLNVEGMSVEKVLAQLVAGEENQPPWRPALGSIPECDAA
ncbi:hypothetical protein SASPL_144311 [Salvia splendens]|uniref:Uncharacterized protein n=1 Tax=Salvia splendens TaxID=180675 RepID=A0A8X8WF01_SALSN|nr:uncharacterized protein LOC121775362 [Salvia splendens]KAG6393742.1 hypothetical protein SASPL_144311 [Salvia splendens]